MLAPLSVRTNQVLSSISNLLKMDKSFSAMFAPVCFSLNFSQPECNIKISLIEGKLVKLTYFETLALSGDCVDEVDCDANKGVSGPLRTPDVSGSRHGGR